MCLHYISITYPPTDVIGLICDVFTYLNSYLFRHFPLDHKSYKSHDNLLLCGTCHLVTSLNEDVLKLRIAKEYDSPIDSGASKLNSDPLLFKVKNAARYLSNPLYH